MPSGNSLSERARRRHIAFYTAVVAGGLAFVVALLVERRFAVGIGANAMFVTYLLVVALELPRLTPERLRRRSDDADAPVGAIFAVTALAVVVAVVFLFIALNDSAGVDPYAVATSAMSVVLGWFTVHTMAAMHYAHEYYEPPDRTVTAPHQIAGGLKFPSEEEPDGAAFLYFAYVIGMTAQVADVAVASRKMRRLVMLHGVFSFFFNTVILAATVNVVVSLAGSR